MTFKDLFQKVGFGTPLHILVDGAVGEEYMESATICDFDITDPDFQAMFDNWKDREIDSITVREGRLFIILKGDGM